MKVILVENKIFSLENVRTVEVEEPQMKKRTVGGQIVKRYNINVAISYTDNAVRHIELNNFMEIETAENAANNTLRKIYNILKGVH